MGLRPCFRGRVHGARGGRFCVQGAALPTVDASALSLDYLLGGIPAKLSFARKPSARAIQRLIAYLQLLKEDIEEADGEQEAGE
jgi:hypothetical protein